MQNAQYTSVSLPFPSRWGLSTNIAGRPIFRGELTINSVSGNTVIGTANFRGSPIPINGYWDENTKQLKFESPYASFSGKLNIFDDPTIKVRHLILIGQFVMKTTSEQAGDSGDWIATTNRVLTGPPISTGALPPVGAFLTSTLLFGSQREF
ncbi:hypothetical protein [Cytobacillus dafuensis]|uniref:Uncharacterized protein n=1 Tax=Cytobacillus dafuensis TaxID=1742359 RepID=A0A5B8Z1C1_CYTDA|nr:hypothetical protein [Cytobacillus dafuensis]QED46755.1 hypothetical protein FSZ17_05385 [Cytobacillus dafuensis]